MRNDIILKLQRIIEGNDRITWELFPQIYDGFVEADQLSIAEDKMLQLVASAVKTCSDDKIISTASEEKIAEYENEFGLSADGLTLDERRQQVIDYINRSRVVNEESLHELCQSLAESHIVYERLDVNNLTLGVFTDDDGELPSVSIVKSIQPKVPQNLSLYAGIETSFERGIVVNHANFAALWAGLGEVEWHEPPEPPIPLQYRYGIMGTDSESADLIPFDESEFALMESTGIQQSYGEFVDDAGLNFVMSQNELMQSTGIQQSYGEFVDDAGLNFVMSQNELMETWEPPTLPTVAPYRKSVQYTGYQINAGDSQFLVDSGNKIAYDASVTYGFRQWVKFSSVQTTPGDIINDGGYIAAKNTGSSAVTGVYAVDYAICSSSQAEVVTVYNTSNEAYNAFKFISNGTDYYYVLDEVQTDWTDDLSSIGYSLTKSLPVVENVRCWLNKNQGEAANVSTSFTRVAYDSSSNRIPYSSSLLYCVFLLSTTTTLDGTFGVANSSGSVAITRSDGTNSTTVYSVYYATCSDSTATIIDVYDSQNNVFKCFKYTQDGTDYYRVMEWQNTHPDWVTDLSSIGYHLPIPSDTATGTINNLALPTAHKEWYTDVTFESLRYYVKGTISDTGSVSGSYFGTFSTWYYGTLTWTDESLGDLTNKIAISAFEDPSITPQSVFRIIFICDSAITGYHSSDTSEFNAGAITSYSYNNGAHSVTFYFTTQWTNGTYSGRIQFRYLDGTTTFKNLSAFDLIGVENGVLSILTTTDRFDMYNTWAGNITIKAYYAEPTTVTTYNSPVTNSVYAKWRGNDSSNPNYSTYYKDVNGISVGSYYGKGTYMNKFYLNIPNNKYVSDAITGVTADGRYFERASSSSSITDSTKGILILNKDIYGWYIILSFYYSDISSGNYALDGSITLGTLGPALPTVEISNSFDGTTSNWLYASDQVIETLAPNATFEPYVEGGYSTYRKALYDTSKSYAVLFINIDTQATRGNPTTVQIVKSDMVIAWKNVTGTSISVFSTKVAVCSSNHATVVTVYNSQNSPYNAFQYTLNGTDYYYVLDGVHAVWTDDLSSIGYFIPVLGYFKNSGASATTNESVSYRYWYALYKADSSSGSVKYLTGDSTKTYLPIAAVKADGTIIDVTSGYMQIGLYGGVSDVIQFKPATSIEAHHLLFKETT